MTSYISIILSSASQWKLSSPLTSSFILIKIPYSTLTKVNSINYKYTSDILDLYTSDVLDLYTGDILDLYTSDIFDLYTSNILDLYTSDILDLFTKLFVNTNSRMPYGRLFLTQTILVSLDSFLNLKHYANFKTDIFYSSG